MKRVFLFAFFILLAVVPYGFAQTPTGKITGTVEDTTGAAIPNAKVTITNIETNATQSTTTNHTGTYVFPLVQPSVYDVTVSAKGFQAAEQKNIDVQVTVGRSVNFKLAVASVSQKVTVSATTPALQTTSATLSTVVNRKLINDIPLNGLNPTGLEVLVPGVSTLGGASTPHIAGSRNANNAENIDGQTNILPENNVGNNLTAVTPIPDSLQEMSVQTSVLSAKYGRFSGGEITMITKSGTNHFHGTLFDFAQTSALYAKPYFSSGPIPSSHLYQFGGTIGGPVIVPHVYNGRNKTFFFFAWEALRQATAQTQLDTVPTAAERNGNFAQSGDTIYNPYTATLQNSGPNAGEYVRQPFPNDQIPQNMWNKVAVNALKYYPMPNHGGNATIFNNYLATGSSTNKFSQFTLRLDQQFGAKVHSFISFTHFHNPNVPFSPFPNAASPSGYNGPGTGTADSISFNNNITFTPTLVGDIRMGYSRSTELRTAFGAPFNVGSLGFPSTYAALVNKQNPIFPTFQLGDGYTGLGSSGYVPLKEDPSVFDFNPSFVKQVGNNSITFGGDWRTMLLNFYQYSFPAGIFGGIDNTWTQQIVNHSNGTGNPVATMLLGLADYGYMTHGTSLQTSSAYGALFAEDDYQALPNLTFNIGLRWSVSIPRVERDNRLTIWDPNLPSPIAGKVPADACLYCSDLKGRMIFAGTPQDPWGRRQGPIQWHDFAPRFGFTWSPDSKTVVRGGYGVVFQPSEMQAAGTTGGAGVAGFSSTTNFNFTLNNQQTVNTTFDNPAPTGFNLPKGVANGPGTDLGQGVNNSFFDSYDVPYSIEGNFSIQRQLPGNIVFTIGYIYNHGVHLLMTDPGIPYSQVNPRYLSLKNKLFQEVPNPFYGIIKTSGSPLAAKEVPYNYLLRPFPQYNGVQSSRKADAGSHYNAITLKLDKQYSHGLTFVVSFTGSKLMDNGASAVNYLGPTSGLYPNQYNPKRQFGLSAADQSKLFSAGYVWQLPIGRGRAFLNNLHGIANELITGWQTNGLIQYTSGTPVVLGAAYNQTGLLGFGQPPDKAPGDANIPNRTRKHWFKTSLFSQPAPFTIGNAPLVLPNVRNPAYFDADMSAFKNNYFGRSQRYNLQFRLEAFNALNHPNFGSVDASVNSGTFGQVNSSAGSPRQVQLALKFIY